MKKFLLVLLIAIEAISTFAQEPVITAPESVSVGQQFSISFEFEGEEYKDEKRDLNWTTLIPIEIKYGPSISRSTNVTYQQGKCVAKYTTYYQYFVLAKESGKLNIEFKGFKDSIVPEHDNQDNYYFERKSNDKPAIEKKNVSSLGKRTNNAVVHKYKSKSPIVTSIMGWCYNISTNRWSGNRQFIYSIPGTEKPLLASPVCYGLQMREFKNKNVHYYVFKWIGYSSLSKRACYLIFNEWQYEALVNMDAKGVLFDVGFCYPLDVPKNDDQEIRAVMDFSSKTSFGARPDDGGVIRFSRGEPQNMFRTADGIVDFKVESTNHNINGYFEMSIKEWRKLFKK